MVGGVLSATVTAKVELVLLPAVSCAEQVTVVVPIGNVAPDAGRHETATAPSRLSLAAGAAYVTVAPPAPVASAVTVPCAAIVGGVESGGGVPAPTKTTKEPAAWFPAASSAEHVTVVEPFGNWSPEAGEHDGVIEPSTRSSALAE